MVSKVCCRVLGGGTGSSRGLDRDLSRFSLFTFRAPSRDLRSRDFVLDDFTSFVAATGGVLFVVAVFPFPFVYPSL